VRTIQDKGLQKKFMAEQGLPTADFVLYDGLEALLDDVDQGRRRLPFVWKSRKGGYDGRGVAVVQNREMLEALPKQACLVESLIPIERELACVCARNPSGEIAIYPVVGMEFHPEANQVEVVHLPSGADRILEVQIEELSRKILESLDHVGLLAIEFFAARDGRILINEMAPRPHNSGHLFNQAAVCSQFEMHLRAILDLPLGSTRCDKAAAMINLVGAEGHSGAVVYKGLEAVLSEPDAHIELYGKNQTRPFRKMGHITVLADSLDEVLTKARRFQSILKVESR
jgi:5-(carboxyamino)imidazole ribonucleotide synthase